MLLLFDAGNTRLKWCLADIDGQFRMDGAIDYTALTAEYLLSLPGDDISAVLVSSVAGADKDALLVDCCDQAFGLTPNFAMVSKYSCGVNNAYQTLDRLGVDRWVAAVGVISASSVNRVVVDAGTAITVDVVDAHNNFMGGVILPGSSLMRRSLVGETAGISAEINTVSSVIGTNTQDCVNAGIRYGLIGGLEAIIREMTKLVVNDQAWEVIVCGGDGAWVMSNLKTSIDKRAEPLLIFKGLMNMRNNGEL